MPLMRSWEEEPEWAALRRRD
uniref:Uncharacterized protein n=1 Tax=Arundo donax TaxID=35708 RepID=A0A0A9A5P8_ARUDO